jgi:hypothetical protein
VSGERRRRAWAVLENVGFVMKGGAGAKDEITR